MWRRRLVPHGVSMRSVELPSRELLLCSHKETHFSSILTLQGADRGTLSCANCSHKSLILHHLSFKMGSRKSEDDPNVETIETTWEADADTRRQPQPSEGFIKLIQNDSVILIPRPSQDPKGILSFRPPYRCHSLGPSTNSTSRPVESPNVAQRRHNNTCRSVQRHLSPRDFWPRCRFPIRRQRLPRPGYESDRSVNISYSIYGNWKPYIYAPDTGTWKTAYLLDILADARRDWSLVCILDFLD